MSALPLQHGKRHGLFRAPSVCPAPWLPNGARESPPHGIAGLAVELEDAVVEGISHEEHVDPESAMVTRQPHLATALATGLPVLWRARGGDGAPSLGGWVPSRWASPPVSTPYSRRRRRASHRARWRRRAGRPAPEVTLVNRHAPPRPTGCQAVQPRRVRSTSEDTQRVDRPGILSTGPSGSESVEMRTLDAEVGATPRSTSR